ncbi:MAG: hypothetical protein DDG59_03165, partial [Anaerolineae bacterium]
EERYAEKFWEAVETFWENHPPYYGVNWLSGQEVALRIMAWSFGYQIFQNASASTLQRKRHLLEGLAVHAARLPCTLRYALAQNNNHLLSEAVGLMTAGTVLQGHPLSEAWWKEGWTWFLSGIRRQIAEDGTYVQHSVNYHRLMLQLALWARLLAVRKGFPFPNDVIERLAEAARWLWDCCEASNGRVPNLGPNDGAYIQPLSQTPFYDYRAVLQAAWRAFVGETPFPKGEWDEMSLWYGVGDQPGAISETHPKQSGTLIPKQRLSVRRNSWVLLRSQSQETWAAFRCPRFFSRPTHADLLHFDLWWQGINLALDAGSYRYTAAPPWENTLAEAFYHNTITVEGRNPMTKAGKFLWLDWAKTGLSVGQIRDTENDLTVVAEHDGYQANGIRLQRRITLRENRLWIIRDRVDPTSLRKKPHNPWIRLHWLIVLCDWHAFEEESGWCILLRLQNQEVRLRFIVPTCSQLRIVKAGRVLFGEEEEVPVYGYCSPTYNCLEEALSVLLDVRSSLPLELQTIWELPN